MPRTIAFLRAINVGGHTVRMDALRGLFAGLGFKRVETLIASGNVIFDSPQGSSAELEATIEAHLLAKLGYAVATFTRTPEELTAAAGFQPFPQERGSDFRVYAGFLKTEPDENAKQRLLEYRSDVDDFCFRGRELFWLCRIASMESAFSGAVLEKVLKMPATMRNVTTVVKMAARVLAAD
jgi:uncharacterized protein (DUF1697 family)